MSYWLLPPLSSGRRLVSRWSTDDPVPGCTKNVRDPFSTVTVAIFSPSLSLSLSSFNGSSSSSSLSPFSCVYIYPSARPPSSINESSGTQHPNLLPPRSIYLKRDPIRVCSPGLLWLWASAAPFWNGAIASKSHPICINIWKRQAPLGSLHKINAFFFTLHQVKSTISTSWHQRKSILSDCRTISTPSCTTLAIPSQRSIHYNNLLQFPDAQNKYSEC